MNGHESVADFSERLKRFQRSDAERNQLLEELLARYKALELKYSEKCDDYNNEVESRRMWQKQSSQHERALMEQKQASVILPMNPISEYAQLTREKGSNGFVQVLLDGDGAIFQDYLFAMGKDGGADAAHLLHGAIKQNLKETYPNAATDDWAIIVQVVCNLQGLAYKLQSCGVVSNQNEVLAFGRAFGATQPLFHFIDAGPGKERADHKIRETLRLFLPNAQCKHVFFGPCHDNGYLVVLEGYKRDYASRLTLIETRPAEIGFRQLGLPVVTFPNIFRSQDLPNTKPITTTMFSSESNSVTSPAPPVRALSNPPMHANTAPFIPKPASPAPSSDSAASASGTWATVGAKGPPSGKTINIAPKKIPPKRHILLNAYCYRMDPVLPRQDKAARTRFDQKMEDAGKNFCNDFHLLGKCENGKWCEYMHGEPLTPGELLVLTYKARSRVCQQYGDCRDFECTYGHHCVFGDRCSLGYCRFEDTHGMDLRPAKKVYEDGSESVA